MVDILDKLADLYKQATEERSHNYTGAVIKEAITHIAGLRALAAINQRVEPQARCSADNVGEPVALINRRLADLAEANALYGKDQRLGAPDRVARNDREISWLKDLRSIILTEPQPAPYTLSKKVHDVAADCENAAIVLQVQTYQIPVERLAEAYKRIAASLRTALSLSRPQSESGK